MFVGVPLVLGLIGCLVVFHTSAPLKFVANSLNTSQSEITLRGVSGSISSGFKIQELTVEGETDALDSRIQGLTFRYRGFWDSMLNDRLIIDEISAESSDFVVGPDFFDTSTANDDAEEPVSSTSPSSGGVTVEGMGLFELRNLNIKNTRIRSADGGFDVSIPTIHLGGLRIEGDDFKLAELEVESDFLTVDLIDAQPERVDNQFIPFSRMIRGLVKPGIHDLIEREMDFTVELASVGSTTKGRFRACGGAVEQVDLPDGGTLLTLREFSIGDYFKLGSKLAPERVSAVFRGASDKPDLLSTDGGEFSLGATRFEIPAQSSGETFEAFAEVGGAKLSALLREGANSWLPTIELSSEPELTIHEILARIYFEVEYEKLDASQKTTVDAFATELAGLN